MTPAHCFRLSITQLVPALLNRHSGDLDTVCNKEWDSGAPDYKIKSLSEAAHNYPIPCYTLYLDSSFDL